MMDFFDKASVPEKLYICILKDQHSFSTFLIEFLGLNIFLSIVNVICVYVYVYMYMYMYIASYVYEKVMVEDDKELFYIDGTLEN